MSEGNGNGSVARLAENAVLTLAFRGVVGVLAVVIAVLGVFAKLTLDDVRDNGKSALGKLEAMAGEITASKGRIDLLDYRVTNVETRVGKVEDQQRPVAPVR